MLSIAIALLLAASPPPAPSSPPRADSPPPLPKFAVDHDDIVINESCRLVIPHGLVINDSDGDGVVHIDADNIVVEFAEGSVLMGSPSGADPDTFRGVGIRIDGGRGVTLKGARIAGFRCAVLATGADGLTIQDARIERNFCQRLRSTPQAEDAADWLRPHANNAQEWRENYGAAVCVEESSRVTVRGLVVRNSQNGLILDRVNDSRVYDSDCSFLSGWGLAMWRSNRNLVCRNAFDFCVRGYSHGVYNRGQDSAGILCFEQCSDNRFIENSATHGGDGFFAFAGREALGEIPHPPVPFDYTGRGCNGNLLAGNDFSDAAAHGVEITFSFDNRIINNRLTDDAICGVWAGYSQRTLIADNTISGNGRPGAAEGGGVNIEHGFRNIVSGNRFSGNSVAISLWSDDDGDLLRTPWARANHRGSADNVILHNTLDGEALYLRLRQTTGTRSRGNTFTNTPDRADRDEGSDLNAATEPEEADPAAPQTPPIPAAIGDRRPVGARSDLAGREQIVMGEWGPWDHQSPMLRLLRATGAADIYEFYGPVGAVGIDTIEGGGDLQTELGAVEPGLPRTLTLRARPGVGVLPFAVRVRARGIDRTLRGTLLQVPWVASVFAFKADPRTDLEGWRAESRGPSAVTFPCDGLAWMNFGLRGPRDLPFLRDAGPNVPGNTRFGVVARARATLPAGRWRVTTVSDDGVRVTIGGPGTKPVIENWTHHAATRDVGTFDQPATAPVDITVEYFQIDGPATLEFGLEKIEEPPRAPPPPPKPTSVP